MRSALFTLLVAAAMTSASASTPPAPAPIQTPDPAFIKPPPGPLSTLAQRDYPGQRISTHAPLHAADIQTVAMGPPAAQTGQAGGQAEHQQEDAAWHGFAPVAVTLALLGAIALRRHRAAKA